MQLEDNCASVSLTPNAAERSRQMKMTWLNNNNETDDNTKVAVAGVIYSKISSFSSKTNDLREISHD